MSTTQQELRPGPILCRTSQRPRQSSHAFPYYRTPHRSPHRRKATNPLRTCTRASRWRIRDRKSAQVLHARTATCIVNPCRPERRPWRAGEADRVVWWAGTPGGRDPAAPARRLALCARTSTFGIAPGDDRRGRVAVVCAAHRPAPALGVKRRCVDRARRLCERARRGCLARDPRRLARLLSRSR